MYAKKGKYKIRVTARVPKITSFGKGTTENLTVWECDKETGVYRPKSGSRLGRGRGYALRSVCWAE